MEDNLLSDLLFYLDIWSDVPPDWTIHSLYGCQLIRKQWNDSDLSACQHLYDFLPRIQQYDIWTPLSRMSVWMWSIGNSSSPLMLEKNNFWFSFFSFKLNSVFHTFAKSKQNWIVAGSRTEWIECVSKGLFLDTGVMTCQQPLHKEAGDNGRQHNTAA